ncbi:MAG: hypothetical protein H6713_24440 [Myxococcales bacterium]|nr:hypothetical protein [Myxococcales bacterium]
MHGNFALLAGRPEAARASLSRSYALRPRPETAQNLAIVAEACGDPEAAARWRATARALRGIE